MPSIDVAMPTVEAGMPRPPGSGEIMFTFIKVSEERGVERKRDQRLVKALHICFSYIHSKNLKDEGNDRV
jgi:hypothetical protein